MKDALIHLLAKNPLLLLFLVAAIGYPLGRVRVRGTQLGVAAVLFVGLAAGGRAPASARCGVPGSSTPTDVGSTHITGLPGSTPQRSI